MPIDGFKLAVASCAILTFCALIAYIVRTLSRDEVTVGRLIGTLAALAGVIAAIPAVITALYSA